MAFVADTGNHAIRRVAREMPTQLRVSVTAVGSNIYPGREAQVDPMKPMLKPPGTKRLKLKCDNQLSNSTCAAPPRGW